MRIYSVTEDGPNIPLLQAIVLCFTQGNTPNEMYSMEALHFKWKIAFVMSDITSVFDVKYAWKYMLGQFFM